MPPKRGAKAAAPEPKAAPKRGGKAAPEEPPKAAAPKREAAPPKAAAPKREAAPSKASEPAEDYSTWTIDKLKERLKELGVSTSGGKPSLVERLRACAPAAEAPAAPKRAAPAKAEPPAEPPAKRAKAGAPAEAEAKGRAAPKVSEPPAKKSKSEPPAAAESAPVELEAAQNVYYEDGEFSAEYAKSSRSKCVRCREAIQEGTMRIGKMVQSDKFDGKYTMWHHAKCFFEGGALPSSQSMIAGFSTLRPDDQKLIAKLVPSDSTSAKVDSKLATQNKKVYEVKDLLSSLSDAQIGEMLELNDYPSKKLHVASSKQDLCADGIVFGATGRCLVCANPSKEYAGGHLLLDGERYVCTGWVSEYLKCTYQTQAPKRTLWQLTDTAKAIPKLKSKLGLFGEKDRLFAAKLKSEDSSASASNAASSSASKPPFLGLNVAIVSTDNTPKEQLMELVRAHGGTISSSITKATSFVITAETAKDDEGAVPEAAKENFVPGVTEAFLTACVEAGRPVDMAAYLVWGEARKRQGEFEVVEAKFIEKAGVMIDADVGSEILAKAHVLFDRANGTVYSEKLNATDMVSGANSYYTLHLLESDELENDEPSYWVFRKWGRTGVKLGGNITEECGKNKSKALKSFCKMYLDKTGNEFGHKREDFVVHPGKMHRVDVTHRCLGKKGQDGDQDEGDGDQGGGALSKSAIEKADKVLDSITEIIKEGGNNTAKIMEASAKYYNLVPHNFGLQKPPPINNDDMVGGEKALLQFYLRMGFEEVSGKDDDKLTPISGVMQLELAKTLLIAAEGICPVGEVKKCSSMGAKMHAKKAGKPKQAMNADLYGSLLLYTGNAIYSTLNKKLREEDRSQIAKYFPYLRMLFEAANRLPTESSTLWRGMSVDLLPQYKVGSTITWWGVSSCTADQAVAQNFANTCGDKSTFLTIETKTACNISEVSFYANEAESILLPGTQLEVVSAERKGKQAHIKLREVGRAVN